MSGTDLAVQDDRPGAIECLIALENAGSLTRVSFDMTDPDTPFETWIAIGRLFGEVSRTVNWLIGDWIIFGENLYGEDQASQGFDDLQSRYSEAQRVTGIDHGTMLNIASICRRVARPQREEALGFWIHEEVAKLKPREQTKWLRRSIKESWNRADLRRAIRDAEKGADPEASDPPGGSSDGLTEDERVLAAAKLVWSQGEVREDGVVVPLEAWAQLGAAFGNE